MAQRWAYEKTRHQAWMRCGWALVLVFSPITSIRTLVGTGKYTIQETKSLCYRAQSQFAAALAHMQTPVAAEMLVLADATINQVGTRNKKFTESLTPRNGVSRIARFPWYGSW